MLETYKLYLPLSKREVTINISIPRNKENIKFDTLYLLDGQNAFSDALSAFGRSIRVTRHLDFAAKAMNKRIIGVAIYNSGSEMGRVNEYSPFNIDNKASRSWKKNDIEICHNFCEDFINTIIPFIDNKYNTYKNADHRYIYGSSLAAITAIYLGFKYNAFNYIGAFSTATFLFEKDFYDFLDKNHKKNKTVFLSVGKKEISDDMKQNNIYLESAIKLKDYFINTKINTRLVISESGIHNEETWDKLFPYFLNFINDKNTFIVK